MCTARHVFLAFFLFTGLANASQVIASFDYSNNGSFVSVEPCTTFTFTIGHGGSHELGDVVLTPWPAPFLWENGFSGSADLTDALDYEPFFHFTRMVESITDGMSEPMFFYGSAWNCNQILTPSPFIMEAMVFQTPTDLIGNNIDFIRLTVNDLGIDQMGEMSHYSLSVSYEFWGTPVPEPATLVLLGVPVFILRHRRRP